MRESATLHGSSPNGKLARKKLLKQSQKKSCLYIFMILVYYFKINQNHDLLREMFFVSIYTVHAYTHTGYFIGTHG